MPREIGWSIEANLLYQIKQLLKKIQGSIYSSNRSTGIDITPYIVTNNGVYQSPYQPAAIDPRILVTSYVYPYINKTYPDTYDGIRAFSNTISVGSTADTTATQFVVSGIDLTIATSFNVTSPATSVTFSDLKYWMSNLTLPLSATFTSLNFPELIFFGGTVTTSAGSGLTSLSFPKLEAIQSTFTNSNLSQSSLSFPELLRMGSFSDIVNSVMISYSFPKLKLIEGSFNISGTKSSLTSISFGALEAMTSIFTMPTTSTSLTSFSFANTLKIFNSNFVTTSNSLNQASVDNILITLAALDGTNGTFAYSSRTVTITGGAATPSAAGLAAKAILVGRGCTVTNN
jgi:hypothetical protein